MQDLFLKRKGHFIFQGVDKFIHSLEFCDILIYFAILLEKVVTHWTFSIKIQVCLVNVILYTFWLDTNT